MESSKKRKHDQMEILDQGTDHQIQGISQLKYVKKVNIDFKFEDIKEFALNEEMVKKYCNFILLLMKNKLNQIQYVSFYFSILELFEKSHTSFQTTYITGFLKNEQITYIQEYDDDPFGIWAYSYVENYSKSEIKDQNVTNKITINEHYDNKKSAPCKINYHTEFEINYNVMHMDNFCSDTQNILNYTNFILLLMKQNKLKRLYTLFYLGMLERYEIMWNSDSNKIITDFYDGATVYIQEYESDPFGVWVINTINQSNQQEENQQTKEVIDSDKIQTSENKTDIDQKEQSSNQLENENISIKYPSFLKILK